MFLLDLTDSFKKHKVPYALVGGYAVALHGAVRGTVDIDLAIRISSNDFRKAEKALNALGLQSRLPVSAIEVFNFREEYINNKNMHAWGFINPQRPSEMVDILISENLAELDTVTKKIGTRKVRVASIADLIRMKTGTGRKQDIEDVKALKVLS